jgi:aminomethyltransferase
MNGNPARVRATPFHTRAAEANEANDWTTRNGFTLSRSYAGTNDEALAARFRVGLADVTWRWRVMLEGARAGEFLSRLVTRDAAQLAPAEAAKALWLGDRGGVRGVGVVARYGKESFLLAASAPDADWVATAAARFEVSIRDVTQAEGGLALVGPYAAATLARAGLPTDLMPLTLRKQFWRGLDITLTRFGEQNGFELWCAAEDAIIVWDRLMRAGEPFGIEPLGLAAADVLDLEAGVARPVRDYELALAGNASTPTPRALGLETLVDEAHTAFNGRSAWLAARAGESLRLVGLAIEAEDAAPHTPVMQGTKTVGRTLASAYSPALRQAIALAQVDANFAASGTELTLTLSPTRERCEFRTVAARVTETPFLPAPDQVAP